jgi:hypothetical protein
MEEAKDQDGSAVETSLIEMLERVVPLAEEALSTNETVKVCFLRPSVRVCMYVCVCVCVCIYVYICVYIYVYMYMYMYMYMYI